MVTARQLASVAQLVYSVAPESQGRRFDSCQGPKVAFFEAIPG